MTLHLETMLVATFSDKMRSSKCKRMYRSKQLRRRMFVSCELMMLKTVRVKLKLTADSSRPVTCTPETGMCFVSSFFYEKNKKKLYYILMSRPCTNTKTRIEAMDMKATIGLYHTMKYEITEPVMITNTVMHSMLTNLSFIFSSGFKVR